MAEENSVQVVHNDKKQGVRVKNMKRIWLRNRKSYYYKILSSFLLFLGMTVFIVVVLNIQSSAAVKEQIILSNQNTMNQVVKLLDTVVAEMRETCVVIANLQEIEVYLNPVAGNENPVSYERYKLSRNLNTYCKDKICDILVWFPEDDYVISGMHTALKRESYCETYYGKSEAMRADFYNILADAPKYPSFYVLDPWGEDTYLSVAMKWESDSRKECVVSVVLDKTYLKGLLEDYYAGRGGFFLLFDQNKKLLLAGNREMQPYNLDDYEGEDIPYETQFGEIRYIMQVCWSDALKGYYAFAVKSDFFWEQLLDIYTFSAAAILLFICLGIVSVIFASKRINEPLAKMVNTFKERNDSGDLYNSNEFEYLERIFRNEWEEKNRLSKEKKVGRQERFIIQLLEGNTDGEDNPDDVLEKNGIVLCSNRFAAGIIRTEEKSNTKHEEVAFIIHNVFEEILGKKDKCYILYASENKYLFLLNLSVETEEEHICFMLEEGKIFLESNFGLKLTIGYSLIHDGISEIKEAYREAKTALNYRYILGKEMIIPYSKIQGRTFSYLDSGQVMMYNHLENYLNSNSREVGAYQFVSEIFESYGINEKISLETLECFKFDVINSIVRIALRCGYSLDERQKMIEGLLKKETLSEFEESLSSLLIAFSQKKLEQQYGMEICSQVKEYIMANYYDTQLGLSQLCEVFKISTSYLSKLYKEKYEVSIPGDITRIRLWNAKKLLQNMDLSINEVAARTGFSNSNVFIKVFKKWEGITPGRYREIYKI